MRSSFELLLAFAIGCFPRAVVCVNSYADEVEGLKNWALSGKGEFLPDKNNFGFDVKEPVIWLDDRVWCNVVPKPKKITEKVVNYFFGKLVMVGPYDSRDNGKRYEFLQKYCEVSTANGKACELEHMTGSLNGKNGFHLMVLQFSEAEKLDIIHLIGEEAKAAAEKVEKAAAQKAEVIKAAVKTAKEAREAAKVAREKAEAIKVALKTA